MKSDVEPGRIKGPPVKSIQLLQHPVQTQGLSIAKMEVRQYVERTDSHLGDYSLLTVVVKTDKGSIEMKYDEGFRGSDALESAAKLLLQYAGLAALINRAIIELSQ
jgi:hypothetical protein